MEPPPIYLGDASSWRGRSPLWIARILTGPGQPVNVVVHTSPVDDAQAGTNRSQAPSRACASMGRSLASTMAGLV